MLFKTAVNWVTWINWQWPWKEKWYTAFIANAGCRNPASSVPKASVMSLTTVPWPVFFYCFSEELHRIAATHPAPWATSWTTVPSKTRSRSDHPVVCGKTWAPKTFLGRVGNSVRKKQSLLISDLFIVCLQRRCIQSTAWPDSTKTALPL